MLRALEAQRTDGQKEQAKAIVRWQQEQAWKAKAVKLFKEQGINRASTIAPQCFLGLAAKLNDVVGKEFPQESSASPIKPASSAPEYSFSPEFLCEEPVIFSQKQWNQSTRE
jgi:hypothetical protein